MSCCTAEQQETHVCSTMGCNRFCAGNLKGFPGPLQIYEGEVEPWLMSDYCTDTVPVLLRRATFCRAFAADAKDFRAYNSWVRALGFYGLKQVCTLGYIPPLCAAPTATSP